MRAHFPSESENRCRRSSLGCCQTASLCPIRIFRRDVWQGRTRAIWDYRIKPTTYVPEAGTSFISPSQISPPATEKCPEQADDHSTRAHSDPRHSAGPDKIGRAHV